MARAAEMEENRLDFGIERERAIEVTETVEAENLVMIEEKMQDEIVAVVSTGPVDLQEKPHPDDVTIPHLPHLSLHKGEVVVVTIRARMFLHRTYRSRLPGPPRKDYLLMTTGTGDEDISPGLQPEDTRESISREEKEKAGELEVHRAISVPRETQVIYLLENIREPTKVLRMAVVEAEEETEWPVRARGREGEADRSMTYTQRDGSVPATLCFLFPQLS